MTLAIVYSRACVGINAPLVTVETHVSGGLPRFNIVGLPAAAVKESRDRVRSALINSGFDFPPRRITVNLAPADLPKEGGRFDLPIAIGILAATGQISADKLSDYEFVGELALSGDVRGVRGVLSVALAAQKMKHTLVLPKINSDEAGLAAYERIVAAEHLLEVCSHLDGKVTLPCCVQKIPEAHFNMELNFKDVRGQQHAKRALLIAAAGQHNLLFIGPPGSGKTMLASRLPSILPELNEEQALAVATIASMGHQGFDVKQWKQFPFRSPHHSSSNAAIVGGGRPPRPGEISLAHQGVLFLDELPEFKREVLESLREPLEAGYVKVSRAGYQFSFPASFQLLAAMNPCPCGFAGNTKRECVCSQEQIQRYMHKLSGPLLDRIDLQVEVASLTSEALISASELSDDSILLKERVLLTRHYQMQRQKKYNKELSVNELNEYCALESAAQTLLNQAMEKFNLSARAYHRVIKVARTIADLVKADFILVEHVAEALVYRCLDKAGLIK